MRSPRWVLHPTLLAGAFVLEVALANKVEPAGFARALVIAVVAGIGLTLIAWAITRDRWIGGLVATTLVIATTSTIPLFFIWWGLRDTLGPTIGVVVVGLALVALIAVPVALQARAGRGAAAIRGPATSALNRFAAVLLVVVVFVNAGPDLPETVSEVFRASEQVSIAPISPLPDIYVILLDGYPRADVLERRFGIDNSSFVDALGNLGFAVGTENHSNYNFTQLTLASMFQMRHIQDIPGLAPLIGQPGAHVNAIRNAFIDSPAFAALRAGGYEVVAIQPGYEHAALRGAADLVLEHGEMTDFERAVLKSTWLLDPLGALDPTLFTGPQRDRIVHAFDDLERLAAEPAPRPQFVWVHIPAPHLPLVLDVDGRALPLDPRLFDESPDKFGITEAQFVTEYTNEVANLNSRVVRAVRTIQAAPRRQQPVIVLMSDHGYGYDPSDVQARLSNLFAASTPADPALLADAPTLVNLMPILLNRFLGTHFTLAKDRYFLAPTPFQLLELTEVPDPN